MSGKKKLDLTDAVSFDLNPAASETAVAPAVPHFVDALQVKRPRIRTLSIKKIVASQTQPRKFFDQSALEELALSIKEKGLIQEVGVKQIKEPSSATADDDLYELVYGERRLRACRMIEMEDIPCRIFDTRDDFDEIALIENMQREDLLPEEQASSVKALIEKKTYTQERAAETLGLKRPHVTKLVSVATFLENEDAANTLSALRQQGAHITFEVLYQAASRATVEEGIVLLKQASTVKLTVKQARQAMPTGNHPAVATLKKIRRNLGSFSAEVTFQDHEREGLLAEVEQTLEICRKAAETLEQLRSRITGA